MNKQLNKMFKYGVVMLTLYTYYIFFFRGGNKMVIVNISMVTGMAIFVVKAFSYLIPALIKEFKETED